MVKTAVRSMAGRLYGASPYFLGDLKGKVLILMYHRVIPASERASTYVQPGMYVTPETFERHLQFLRAHFKLLSLQELLDRWDSGAWDNDIRYCVITFDDGWLDNYQHAYPLLRAYRAPATIFVPTGSIGTNEWLWSDRLGYLLHRFGRTEQSGEWDSLIERAKAMPDELRDQLLDFIAGTMGVQFARARRFIDWNEAREMSRHGIAFGSHTSTHAILTRLGGAALERELQRPTEVLGEQGVNYVPVLAYPNGDYNDSVIAAARAAGYRAAVTTEPGPESRRPADPFRLKRIGVHDDVSRSISLLTFHIARQAWQTPKRERLSLTCLEQRTT